jgi:hypothetical protein
MHSVGAFFKNTVAIRLRKETAVLLGFGFVFASAFAKASARQAVTGRCGHAPSLSLAKTQNSSLPNGYCIFSNALIMEQAYDTIVARNVQDISMLILNDGLMRMRIGPMKKCRTSLGILL